MTDDFNNLIEDKTKELNNTQNLTQEEKVNILGEIRVYNLLSKLSGIDKYIAFDSGIFNDILKGYIECIIDVEDINLTLEQKNKLRLLTHYALDEISSKEAEDKYYEIIKQPQP